MNKRAKITTQAEIHYSPTMIGLATSLDGIRTFELSKIEGIPLPDFEMRDESGGMAAQIIWASGQEMWQANSISRRGRDLREHNPNSKLFFLMTRTKGTTKVYSERQVRTTFLSKWLPTLYLEHKCYDSVRVDFIWFSGVLFVKRLRCAHR
jgi:hypothetical protein